MTMRDRTDELVRGMLERRASRPVPDWLLDQTMRAIATAPQDRRGLLPTRLPSTPASRMLLVAAVALLVLLLAGGALAAAGLLELPGRSGPPLRAAIVAPSTSPDAMPAATDAPATSPVPSDAPRVAITPKPVPPPLAVDSLAAVTTDGNGLRVRSAPGTGADSKKLSPLLPKGARMLVTDGPVRANGMDWYEVMTETDEGLFGWVAVGKDGETWIRPVAPKCRETLDATAVWKMSRLDFLVCYGDAPVTIDTELVFELDTESVDDDAPACPWTGGDVACTVRPSWLWELRDFGIGPTDEFDGMLYAAIAPGVDPPLGEGAPVIPVTMTLAMDAPEASDCRVVDSRNRNLMPKSKAITVCRLTFVVRSMSWEPVQTLGSVPSIATVLADTLPVSPEIGEPPSGPTLRRGDRVLAVEGMDWIQNVAWYQVAPADGSVSPAGWVPLLDERGQRTMDAVPVDCPPKTDWSAIETMPPGDRVVCFGADPITLELSVVQQEAADPARGLCGQYTASTPSPRPCVALPGWLTSYSGISGSDPAHPGPGIELRFNPELVQRNAFPTTPTVMRVTGSFVNDASYECIVRDAETGAGLITDVAASASCKEAFVVTDLGVAP